MKKYELDDKEYEKIANIVYEKIDKKYLNDAHKEELIKVCKDTVRDSIKAEKDDLREAYKEREQVRTETLFNIEERIDKIVANIVDEKISYHVEKIQNNLLVELVKRSINFREGEK